MARRWGGNCTSMRTSLSHFHGTRGSALLKDAGCGPAGAPAVKGLSSMVAISVYTAAAGVDRAHQRVGQTCAWGHGPVLGGAVTFILLNFE